MRGGWRAGRVSQVGVHFATACLLVFTAPQPTHAEETGSDVPDFGRAGVYMGIGGAADIDVDRGVVVGGSGELLVGYRFNEYAGADLDLQVTSDVAVKVVAEGRLFLPGAPLQPYLLLGLGTWVFTGSGGEAFGVLRPGFGIDFYLSRHVVLSPIVTYELILFSDGVAGPSDVYFGGTIQYRF